MKPSSQSIPSPDPARHSTLARKTARGAGFVLGANAASFVVDLVAATLLSRWIGPADFGIVVMVLFVTGFFSIVANLGMNRALMRYETYDDDLLSTTFWLGLASALIFTIAIYAGAPWFGRVFHEPRIVPVLRILIAILILNSFGATSAFLLQRRLRFGAIVAVQQIASACGWAAALFTGWRGAGLWALPIKYIVEYVATILPFCLLARWRPSFLFDANRAGELLRAGAAYMISDIFSWGQLNFDKLLIGRYWSAAQLGIYSRAYSWLMMPAQRFSKPLEGLGTVALRESVASFGEAHFAFLRSVTFVTFTGTAILVGLADEFVDYLLGPGWAEVVPVARAFCVASLAQPVFAVLDWGSVARGFARRRLFLNGAYTLTLAVGCLIALRVGPVAVAYAYGAIGAIFVVAAFVVFRLPLVDSLRAMAEPAALASFVGVAIFAAKWGLRGYSSGLTLLGGFSAVGAASAIWVLVSPRLRRDILLFGKRLFFR